MQIPGFVASCCLLLAQLLVAVSAVPSVTLDQVNRHVPFGDRANFKKCLCRAFSTALSQLQAEMFG